MEPATVVLGGITVSVISATVGKFIGERGKVSDVRCKERREACLALIIEKIDHLTRVVEGLGCGD